MASPSIPQGIIYLHTNLLNGKVYVGQTWSKPKYRWRAHIHDAEKGRKGRFQAAVRKYGADAFDQQVIGEAATQAQLDNLEKVWIILLQSRNREFGYNLREGGNSGRLSEEQCQEMSRTRKGRIPWNKGKKGVQVAWNKGKPSPWTAARNRNRTWTDEERQQHSQIHKGILHSDEAKQKCSDASVGYWSTQSEEQKQQHMDVARAAHYPRVNHA